ncbi:stage II sporulation protein P [Limnochorda sp.]|uniref:stage II sporulation protein P n=1 Tax=Limnochorda sp. TaxID=1940279 RepID=UPI0039C0D53D
MAAPLRGFRSGGGRLRLGGRRGLLQGLAGAWRRAGTGRRRWARRRELPRMAWGRPAMAWGLARSSRRPRVVPFWRPATLPGPGWALRPLGDGGPARRGHRLQRAFPARAAGAPRPVPALGRLLLVLLVVGGFLVGRGLGAVILPYWEAAAPYVDRLQLDGERAARLVASALPRGSEVEAVGSGALAAGAGDGEREGAAVGSWSDRIQGWASTLSRRLPEWLLLSELPLLQVPAVRPAAAPAPASGGPAGPAPNGTPGEAGSAWEVPARANPTVRPAGVAGPAPELLGPEGAFPEGAFPDGPAAAPAGILSPGPGREPLVLLYHTHISEMYQEPGQPLMEPSRYHRFNTTDTGVARAGAALARALEARGIPVLHDRGIYDVPSHSQAYAASGRAVARILEAHPSIQVVIDLHRDTPAGLVTTVGGRRVAQITLVVGTGTEPGGDHASWQPNLAFAQELAAALNRQAPGVFNRILRVPNRRYNQELHPNAILVELGSYHNTLAEAEAAAEILAASLAQVLHERLARSPGPSKGLAPAGEARPGG